MFLECFVQMIGLPAQAKEGIPMKTTIEIPDELFRQVKAKAALSGIHLFGRFCHFGKLLSCYV